jgi:large subunit ribosomal protein L6
MSRIGHKPISVPAGVEVRIEENLSIVKGPKGELRQHIPNGIDVQIEDGTIRCARPSDAPHDRANGTAWCAP